MELVPDPGRARARHVRGMSLKKKLDPLPSDGWAGPQEHYPRNGNDSQGHKNLLHE